MPKVAVGSDHGGFELKEKVKTVLIKKGFEVKDMGCFSKESCDYPDFGFKVAQSVGNKQFDNGVVICTTGVGMSMVANKVHNVRAGLCYTPEAAALARAHNNANILAMGAKYVEVNNVEDILTTFFETRFEGGRHLRRVNKIDVKGE